MVLIAGALRARLNAWGRAWMPLRSASKRELTERAVREGENHLRAMANNISELAWMTDAKGAVLWYNERWFEYTGTTLEEMAGCGWQKVHHPDHLQRAMAEIGKCFSSGDVWEDLLPLRGRDGSYRSFRSRAVPIRNKRFRDQ